MSTRDLDNQLDPDQEHYEDALEARERAIQRRDALSEQRRQLDLEIERAGKDIAILTGCARLWGQSIRNR